MAGLIRVLVVDDDALVRVGLSLVLGSDPAIEVVGEAADGADALVEFERLEPDVVLMDIRMPKLDGLAAAERLLARTDPPAIIMLTTFDTDDHILRALRLGANGFLLKDTPPVEITRAVHKVAAGESMLSGAVVGRLIRYVVRDDSQSKGQEARRLMDTLTDRERDVALAVSAGQSNHEISAALFMSVATVKVCVSRILTKLGCSSRIQIAILVHESNA